MANPYVPSNRAHSPTVLASLRLREAALTDGFDAVFTAQFSNHFPRLFSYLARLTGDADQASDLAQSAFVELYQRGSLPDDPGAWLVTVAHNRLRDQHRAGRRRLALLTDMPDRVPVPATLPGPDTAVETIERRDRVRQALDELSERDRQILLLHHSGHSYREIAATVGVADRSVGTLLRRAGSTFRHAFERRFGAPD